MGVFSRVVVTAIYPGVANSVVTSVNEFPRETAAGSADGLPEKLRLTAEALQRRGGHAAEAETLYRAAVAQRPEDAAALNNLGVLARERGASSEAEEWYMSEPPRTYIIHLYKTYDKIF